MSVLETGLPDLIGSYTWEEWQKESGWDLNVVNENVSNYFSDYSNIDQVKNLYHYFSQIPNNFVESKIIEFTLFGGSWCGDSFNQMPIIVETIGKIKSENTSLSIYGVNRLKDEPSELIKKYDIQYLPTLIISVNRVVKGRIIETPEISWASDILDKIQRVI